MTLIVSLRIPDGIVIAGDSLSTTMNQLKIQGEFGVKCPECGHEHSIGPVDVGPINMPSTTFSYAQKVFPFLADYGVGTFGQGLLMGKTMHFAMRELEQDMLHDNNRLSGVREIAKTISEHAHTMLKEQVKDLDKSPDDWYAVGFHVVGYEESKAKSVVAYIGKDIRTKIYEGLGCTYSGQGKVVKAIWGLYKNHPEDQAAYPQFSLQDAIAYAEFLIGTTASYQQFSRSLSTVGGDVDIGLVTPFDGFKWIKQKPLAKIIGGRQ